jgi:16S rRNA processing protein RimM
MAEDEPGGEELLVVGRILRPHGLRGAVIVGVESDWPERFREGAVLLLEAARGECEEVEVESASPHKGNALIYLSGVTGREEAEKLKGRNLYVRARDAAPLGDGEFWAHELVGMLVIEEDGSGLGQIDDVLCQPAQDLLVVRRPDGEEFRVPFVKEFVKGVDPAGRTVTVRVIEGMVP